MGAAKYSDHNYLKGMPYSAVINHIENHLNKLKEQLAEGVEFDPSLDDDLAGIVWGAFTLMQFDECGRREELNDLTPLYNSGVPLGKS